MAKSLAGLTLVVSCISASATLAEDTFEWKPLIYEAEDYTTPKHAWLKDKTSPDHWNLWSTDVDAHRKWSGGVVLQSPIVKADRAAPEDGAPPLHTRITGIPPGRYEIEIKLGRTLAVSRDGKTWEKKQGADQYLGVVNITDGTFELWGDDRFVHTQNPGACYYDYLVFHPVPPRVLKPRVTGFAQNRVGERLDRGLVAVPAGDGRIYVGWRLLTDDPKDAAFNVYRSSSDRPTEKLNAAPLTRTTDFLDTTAPAGAECEYTVRLAMGTGEGDPSRPVKAVAGESKPYFSIELDPDVTVQKAGIGDLDGDGRYDYVLKQPQDNIDPASNYWKPSPDTYKLDAYTRDGRRLWRKDLGWAIERGIWYSPFVVHDLDGDGKAEVAVKTGEGDPRGPDGRVETGPEWVSTLDGSSGRELARADIDAQHPGSECHAADIDRNRHFAQAWLFSAQGKLLSDQRQQRMSQPVYWDADHQRELLRGSEIHDFDGGTHPTRISGRLVAIADVLGDWREELITSLPGELRIYTTTIPAADRRVTLMEDPIYRLDVAVAAMGYYAAPMLSYDLASEAMKPTR